MIPIERAEYLLDLEAGAVKEIRNSPPADLFEEILELQDTLNEYRAAGRTFRSRVDAPREAPIGTEYARTAATGHGGRPAAALCSVGHTPGSRGGDRARREPSATESLKQMRENLSNRTYVKNIVNDLVSTIG